MKLLEELEAEGADIAGGLQRLGNKADFYVRMLGRLPGLVKEKSVTESLIENDPALAVENAHAIKGAAGNLSVTPLYEAYSEIVTLLRDHNNVAAVQALQKAMPVQDRILSIIEKHK